MTEFFVAAVPMILQTYMHASGAPLHAQSHDEKDSPSASRCRASVDWLCNWPPGHLTIHQNTKRFIS